MKRSIEKIGYSRKLQGTIGLCVALAASGVAAGDRQPSSYDLALAERQAALQSTVENRADVIANLAARRFSWFIAVIGCTGASECKAIGSAAVRVHMAGGRVHPSG